MIEDGLIRPWPPEVIDAVKPFLQGHLIERTPLSYAADLRFPVWETTHLLAEDTAPAERGLDFVDLTEEDRAPYGIITTQSCDLAEERLNPRQPWLAFAPVYAVSPDSPLLDRDHIHPLDPPSLGEGTWVADLRIEVPLEKSVLVGRTPIEAFSDEAGYIQFGRVLARRRGRPALASVVHETISETTRALKDRAKSNKKLARRVREQVYKLMIAVESGTRLQPTAMKLYVIVDGAPTDDAKEWFALWWNEARVVASQRGLQLHPVGWLDSRAIDARLYDDLVEIRSPL